MPEKFTSVERVIGKHLSPKKKAEFIQFSEKLFTEQNPEDKQVFKDLLDLEREKTPVEIILIERANELTNELSRIAGLPDLNVGPKNIHFIPNDRLKRKGSDPEDGPINPDISGRTFSLEQMIVMYDFSFEKPKIVSFHDILHEVAHLKSYCSLRERVFENVANAIELLPYRSGISINTFRPETKRKYGARALNHLNEAITEELVKRLVIRVRNEDLFLAETSNTDENIKKYGGEKDSGGNLILNGEEYFVQSDEGDITGARFIYERERKMLNILIDKIYDRNKDIFSSREDVFNVFIKAYMTGNIIPMGKLIDKTFGRGSFKRIAKSEKSLEDQEKVVESL